jgi:hypothetical protein
LLAESIAFIARYEYLIRSNIKYKVSIPTRTTRDNESTIATYLHADGKNRKVFTTIVPKNALDKIYYLEGALNFYLEPYI